VLLLLLLLLLRVAGRCPAAACGPSAPALVVMGRLRRPAI
jgi:hypothetical protein